MEPVQDPMPETIAAAWQKYVELSGLTGPDVEAARELFEAGACFIAQLVKQHMLHCPLGLAVGNIRKLCDEADAIIERRAENEPEPERPSPPA